VIAQETVEAVRALAGCRLTDFGRTVNMAEISFERDDGTKLWLHASCQLRVVREGRILVGSYDMHHPMAKNTDSDAAFDNRTTMYDRQATRLTAVFTSDAYVVLAADVLDTGDLVIDVTDSVRIQAIPTCSGPIECWRLFERGGDHHVYP
jgi:hypothetical protein